MSGVAQHPTRAAARLVWLIAAVGIALLGLLVASYAGSTAGATPVEVFAALSLAGSMVAFIVCGALIVSRQPRNVVGWLLMIPGLALPASTLATNWLGAMPPPSEVTPLLWLVLWTLSWSWILLIFPIFHLLLTFPDGRLLSPRWRLAVALEVAMVSIFLGFTAFAEDLGVLVEDERAWTIPNPIGFLPNSMFDDSLGVAWEIGLIAITIASAAAVILRFRRGSTIERQQLKWPLLAVILFGAVYAGASLYPDLVGGGVDPVRARAGRDPDLRGDRRASLPALRDRPHHQPHGLLGGDHGGILVAVFAAGVLGLQFALAGVTETPTLAVAASTLAGIRPVPAAPPARPARRRPAFDRARIDAERTAQGFGARLRDEVAIDTIAADLHTTVDRSVRPSTQGLWLRGAPR